MCLVGNFFASWICGDPYFFLRKNLKNNIVPRTKGRTNNAFVSEFGAEENVGMKEQRARENYIINFQNIKYSPALIRTIK